MIEGFVGFYRFKDEEEYKKMVEKAREDNHGVFIPTHPLKKNLKGGEQEIVGYASVGHPGAVLVFGWLSTKELSARESFHIINTIEDMVSRSETKTVCMPMPKDSPFHPLMESMGYSNAGTYDFFVKKV